MKSNDENGKLSPAERPFRPEAPAPRWADLKLHCRSFQLARGHAAEGSSPAELEKAGLTDEPTVAIKQSEGEKLRR